MLNTIRTHVLTCGILEEKRIRQKQFEEIMAKNFSKLSKDINPEIQESL